MSFFAQYGKKLLNASAVLVPGTLTTAIFTPLPDEFTDVYSVVITTSDTANQTLTLSDGTLTVTYLVGGGGSAGAPLIVDQASIPVRFRRGGVITVAVGAITTGKSFAINIRGLSTKT